MELDCYLAVSEERAFLSSGFKGVGLGKCGPPGEEMANAWYEQTGFVNYKCPCQGPIEFISLDLGQVLQIFPLRPIWSRVSEDKSEQVLKWCK